MTILVVVKVNSREQPSDFMAVEGSIGDSLARYNADVFPAMGALYPLLKHAFFRNCLHVFFRHRLYISELTCGYVRYIVIR